MSCSASVKRCLVTGASSGLGEALAAALAARGWPVWGTARDSARITASGVTAVPLDLSDAVSLRGFMDWLGQEGTPFDLVVNNAGGGLFGDFARFDNQQITAQMELLLLAPLMITRAVLPHMLMRGSGCIANVSSLAAQFPLPCMSLYNSAKAGLSAFTCSLAQELRGSGVRAIDFRPGDFQSRFNDNARRSGGSAGAWAALERNLHRAPTAEATARDLLRAIDRGASGTVVSGSFFQARLAPLGQRLLPASIIRALSRAYFQG